MKLREKCTEARQKATLQQSQKYVSPKLAQMKALKGVIVTDCSFRLNHQSKYYLSFSHYSPCCYFSLSSV